MSAVEWRSKRGCAATSAGGTAKLHRLRGELLHAQGADSADVENAFGAPWRLPAAGEIHRRAATAWPPCG
ncbi:MAG: hypothetical protein U0641_09265 [Anaerolineae bacterium]